MRRVPVFGTMTSPPVPKAAPDGHIWVITGSTTRRGMSHWAASRVQVLEEGEVLCPLMMGGPEHAQRLVRVTPRKTKVQPSGSLLKLTRQKKLTD